MSAGLAVMPSSVFSEEQPGLTNCKTPDLLQTTATEIRMVLEPEDDEKLEEEEDEEGEEEDGVPYDRGWCWVMVFGLYCCCDCG